MRALALLLLFFFPSLLRTQENVSVSVANILRYGTSNTVVNQLLQRREYFENLTDARLSVYDVTIGFRLLYDSPPEFGQEFTGLRQKFVEFRRDDFAVRAGDSYTLFGRGMALNVFENRGLGFDTGIEGVKLEYKSQVVRAVLTGGNIRYVDILDPARVEQYSIRGGSVEVIPHSFFSFGINFVSGTARFPVTPQGEDAGRFDMPEVFVRGQVGEVDLFFSYAEKRTGVVPNAFLGITGGEHKGTGFYGAVSYAADRFGISLEYKDYRFGITDPAGRLNPDRLARALAFQNPPIVHKEHSFTLLTRYPHVVDFNDEVGYQIDVFVSPVDRLQLSANFAAASKHYAYTATTMINPLTGFPVYVGTGRTTSWLPTGDARYSPFWELYVDAQYYLHDSGTDHVILGFNRRKDRIAEELAAVPTVDEKSSYAVPLAVEYTLSGEWVMRFSAERQWVRDDTNPVTAKFTNQLFSLSLSKSPTYSVTLRHEFTNDKGTVDGRRDWTAIDIGYRLSPEQNILLSIGGDRGGQVCANGICRIVPPFLGVRASVISYF